MTSIEERVYPEQRFGGYSRFDGTIHFCSRVRALLPPGAVVLDVGCGRAQRVDDPCAFRCSIQNFNGEGRRVIGIDVDPRAESNPFIDDFRLIEDLDRWPVEDASIDLIYSDYVLEHVEHPDRYFAEAWRVLRPGGTICMRTPNKWCYVAILSRLIADRHHGKVTAIAQRDRKEQDVFPTFYRANTRSGIARQMRARGFEACVYRIEGEPSYLRFNPLVYRIGALVHRVLPPILQSTLLAFGRKPAAPNTP